MKVDDSITRFELVPYFHGRILEISEGRTKAFPHFIWYQDVRINEPSDLSVFSDSAMDGVFSSNLLHLLSEDEVKTALKEWSRVVRCLGHIVVHVPESGGKWDTSCDGIAALMDSVPRCWDMVDEQRLESGRLYAFMLT